MEIPGPAAIPDVVRGLVVVSAARGKRGDGEHERAMQMKVFMPL